MALRSVRVQAFNLTGSGVNPAHLTACRLQNNIRGSLQSLTARGAVRHYAQQPTKNHSRQRLPSIYAVPLKGKNFPEDRDAFSKLIRAGFLRQAFAGIFHMLPLGLRVQEKAEALIDKHMMGIGASKVSLSSISSQDLWRKSGRLDKSSELFLFKDRKDGDYLLSPTHEEEITTLVKNTLVSYKQLPIKMYQISRKYRDELRPRKGLLRGREFIMKDLYTFDVNSSDALETYNQVKEAYVGIFNELKLPYLIAEADSGDIGGDLSHEFHFPTPEGEDHIISCETCGYAANEELAEVRIQPANEENEAIRWTFSPSIQSKAHAEAPSTKVSLWRGVSKDRKTLVNVWYPSSNGEEVNPRAIKAVFPDLDSGVEDPVHFWLKAHAPTESSSTDNAGQEKPMPEFINIFDSRIPMSFQRAVAHGGDELNPAPQGSSFKSTVLMENVLKKPLHLTRIQTGDRCPRCPDGHLTVQKSIELGHTFFLGTRYSKPLGATVQVPSNNIKPSKDEHTQEIIPSSKVPASSASGEIDLEMGCHGIGVTRMIGAVAEVLADDRGLKWPRVLAPYEVVVMATKKEALGTPSASAEEVYDILTQNGSNSIDAVLDDRYLSFAIRSYDADLVGYPIIVVVGKGWEERRVEVQCRHLGIKEEVGVEELKGFVEEILEKL